MKKTRTLIAIIVALVVVSGVLALGWIGTNSTLQVYAGYAGQLENSYQKSFSELVTNINNIEINLSKALISMDNKRQKELYQKINQQCLLSATNLSNLPINHESIVETTKFVNQLGGFSYYLSQKLEVGDALSNADTTSVNDLYNLCVYVQTIINDYAKQLNGEFSILNSTEMGNTNTSFDNMFANTSSTGTDYPTLIYDGPFSDSIKNKEILGLSGEEITPNKAEEIIKNAFSNYNIKNLKQGEDVGGKFESYSYSFETKNRKYYTQITKKGGLLLSVSSNGNLKEKTITLKSAELEAENFAKKLGLQNMKCVWSTTLGGVAYINLTPIINDVIIYPDMIKAKVSLDTGSILGWEAQSYAYNHNERKDFNFSISEQTARIMVSKELLITNIRKCIIPIEYGEEQLCYEYKCTYNNYTYYVYISAKTGMEIQTLRVVKTTNGNLLE